MKREFKMSTKTDVAFVMNIPSPYRLYLFRELYQFLLTKGISFHVHFMAKGHADRPQSWLNPKIDFPHTYWHDYGFGQHHFNPGLIWYLLRHPPKWLHLGSPFDTFTCILLSFLNRKSVLCAGSEGNTKTPGQLHGFKGWLKRAVYTRCPYVTVAGQEGVRFIALHQSLTKKTMPKPVLLPNLVDEKRFCPRGSWNTEEIEATRSSMGASMEDRICLIPARFVWEKGLIPFFKLLTPKMLEGWRLVIMGHGPLQDEVEALIDERCLRSHVMIIRSVPYDKMPIYYAAGDLMLLPSVYDQNPLTVIEALCSGLPLALSEMAGNVDEAVTPGVNGWVLPVTQEQKFVSVLNEVFSTPIERLRQMGRHSLNENAQFWNTNRALTAYIENVLEVIDLKRSHS